MNDGRRRENGRDGLTAPYKLSVVERADACETPGEVGEMLRREGLYGSHLSAWRRAMQTGSPEALGRRRGPKPSVDKGSAEQARLGRAPEVIRERREVLAGAWAVHPKRFVAGPPRAAELPEPVRTNPPLPVTHPKVSAKVARRRFTVRHEPSGVEHSEWCETPGEIDRSLLGRDEEAMRSRVQQSI